MEPLAHKMRPLSFDDVIGQNHLIGENGILRKMIENKKILSFILYGPPGTGKTTIANIFAKESEMETYFFNASTDNKKMLQDILDVTNFNNILLIVDEVHRMNKDIQDVLLPYVENGKVSLIGLTTNNPYYAVNYAIRSRVNIYEITEFSDDDIKKAIIRALSFIDIDITINEEAYSYIIRFSNKDIRSAINILESATLYLNDGDTLTQTILNKVAGKVNQSLDKDSDNYYLLLSALQKSIRGSDVDASVHYLARLLTLGDLKSIIRRLLVIAYEDIGLAQPQMGQKVLAAAQAAEIVGMPEARIILGTVVVDMAISPKSNSAYLAVNDAINDYQNKDTGSIPSFLDNNLINANPEIYKYPHDYKDALVDDIYLPDKIKEKTYFHPKDDNRYEKALKTRLEQIDKIKGKIRKKNAQKWAFFIIIFL